MKINISARGGGTKCTSYIGALDTLVKNDYTPEIFLGCSAGVTVLMPFAFGYSIKDTINIANTFSNLRFISLHSLFTFNLWDDSKWKDFLYEIFGKKNLSDLKYKFIVQLYNTNLESVELVEDGEIVELIIATMAFPHLFGRQEINHKYYRDAQNYCNYEVDYLKKINNNLNFGLQVQSIKTMQYEEWEDLDLVIDNLGYGITRIDFLMEEAKIKHGKTITTKYLKSLIP